MPRLRKAHFHKTAIFVTISVEEGIPFACNPLINLVLTSCLALAQSHYPVIVSHYHVEGTHLHLLIVVDNPDDVPNFIGRFKTESAHRINRLLGRKKHTLWCEGYDSPVLLQKEDVIDKVGYIYANPAQDGLTDSIDEYPGMTSWRMWDENEGGEVRRQWQFAPRTRFRKVTKDAHNREGYVRESQRIKCEKLETLEFSIEPNAWMECFGVDGIEERKDLNNRIVGKVRELEARAREIRRKERKTVIGREKLLRARIDVCYQPDRRGKRVWCICSDFSFRNIVIKRIKELAKKAREVYLMWKSGDFSEAFPLGLYPPSMPKLSNPVSLSAALRLD